MKVEEGKYSLAEIVDWFKNRNLVVNSDYQRGGGLWPASAKSYFIDTILRDFPFPKVYFHESIDRTTMKPKREIVDGQQRITTIVEFVEGKFALGQNAREFAGCRFEQLPENVQDIFWTYTVSVDVIRNADRNEILQMFRRMNAFTLPLNASEKRHSQFFGLFKDWVNSVLDREGRILTDWGVLTSRQVVRMADAEFITDLSLAVSEGVVSTSPAKLMALYKQYDGFFDAHSFYDQNICGVLNATAESLSGIKNTFATKPHIFHSLLCAMLQNDIGLPGGKEATGLTPIGMYFTNPEKATISIRKLAVAHEEKDMGEFAEFVRAASEGGNRAAQRAIRIRWLGRALRGEFA